ncbi:MAG: 6-phosphofructokinase [Clostridia bacterium]|nr:6-phosphofructokinase [Clostridia bacterium]
MKDLKGKALFAQSGGPTAVINASLAGGITEALKNPSITGVLVAANGVYGVLNEVFYDMQKEDEEQLLALKYTPAMAFGSVRCKLSTPEKNSGDLEKILEIFKKYDIKYFFYNGGNDSMDTCDKISSYMKKAGYPVNVIGIPKTIDNDLAETDCCPGYGSAAKYVATSVSEVALDASIYTSPLVIIVEIMGRNAGWLAAAASLSQVSGYGADLVYLPEVPFSAEKFISDVKKVVDKKVHCVVAVSEGIKYENGKYVGDDSSKTDVFGHTALGGVCGYLKSLLTAELGVKCKAIELNILQRCAAHQASKTDADEAYECGRIAVIKATEGETDKMVAIKRTGGQKAEFELVPLNKVANAEKKVPLDWIDEENAWLKKPFFDYALPLIEGENPVVYESGLPKFAKMKKILFKL